MGWRANKERGDLKKEPKHSLTEGLSCRSHGHHHNNSENARGDEPQRVGGSQRAEHVRARLCVTHSMQPDHTVLLVCGISRLKIAAAVGGEEEEEEEGRRAWSPLP